MDAAKTLFDAVLPAIGRSSGKRGIDRVLAFEALSQHWLEEAGEVQNATGSSDEERKRRKSHTDKIKKLRKQGAAVIEAVDLMKDTPLDERPRLIAMVKKLSSHEGRQELAVEEAAEDMDTAPIDKCAVRDGLVDAQQRRDSEQVRSPIVRNMPKHEPSELTIARASLAHPDTGKGGGLHLRKGARARSDPRSHGAEQHVDNR